MENLHLNQRTIFNMVACFEATDHGGFLSFSCPVFLPNEPVEKVGFLKSTSSARSKIGNYFPSSKMFTILGAMSLFP